MNQMTCPMTTPFTNHLFHLMMYLTIIELGITIIFFIGIFGSECKNDSLSKIFEYIAIISVSMAIIGGIVMIVTGMIFLWQGVSLQC